MNSLSPASPSAPDVSAVILTLNEAGNIGGLLNELKSELSRLVPSYELIVVDAGSSDSTVSEAEAEGALCFQQRRPGFGGALREGITRARGKYVLTLDADWSHPPEVVPSLWAERENADIIVASRYVKGGDSDASLWRTGLSILLNRFFSRVLFLPCRDISSGFRLYRRSILTPDLYRAENFDILEEILVRAITEGRNLREVPLQYRKRAEGISHASCLKFAKSFLPTLFRMWVLRNLVSSADYDHRAYDSVHPPQRWWQRRRFRIVNDFLPEGLILDAGCGSSRVTQGLKDRGVALDISAPKLRFLRRVNPMRVRASAVLLPFRDSVFDGVIESQVLQEISSNPTPFCELNRVIRPGGIAVIGVTDHGRIWWPVIGWFYNRLLPNTWTSAHAARYTRHVLIDLLAEHGFRVLNYRYICGAELIVQAQKVENILIAR